MRSIVVIPTIRDLSFLDEWRNQLEELDVFFIVCEDRDKVTLKIPNGLEGIVYSHREIEKELGKDSWIIPFSTSAIRSFGFWKAWQMKPDMIVTLDDDCFPYQPHFLQSHYQNLQKKATLDWVITGNLYTRGFPYGIREKNEVVLSHGTWAGIPDLDAPTQLVGVSEKFETSDQIIPRHNFFPMSGMNLAWNPKITPLMYFGLQGSNYPYDRFDDIWAGIFAKKILDRLDLVVWSGSPMVDHRRKSNVFTNLKKEATGIEFNEVLWQEVKEINLTKNNIKDCYRELIKKLPDEINLAEKGYILKLKETMLIWLDLFS